jgi:hypothetical protein
MIPKTMTADSSFSVLRATLLATALAASGCATTAYGERPVGADESSPADFEPIPTKALPPKAAEMLKSQLGDANPRVVIVIDDQGGYTYFTPADPEDKLQVRYEGPREKDPAITVLNREEPLGIVIYTGSSCAGDTFGRRRCF